MRKKAGNCSNLSTNEAKALAPIDKHNPLPGLQSSRELLTKQIELVKTMQLSDRCEPIERALKSFEALLAWNRWTQINYTDHTEETADAEKTAEADFQATALTDGQWEAFWREIGPLERPKAAWNWVPELRFLMVPLVLVAGFFLSAFVVGIFSDNHPPGGARPPTRTPPRSPQKSQQRSTAWPSPCGCRTGNSPRALLFQA